MTLKQWLTWALTPSGDHVAKPSLWAWLREDPVTWFLEAPLPAHAFGGFVVWLVTLPLKLWVPWPVRLAVGLALLAAWQLGVFDAHASSVAEGLRRYPPAQMAVRLALGGIPLAVLVVVC